MIKVLGAVEANSNKFYKTNKTNTEFIHTLTIGQGNKSIKFFTETGLYECLFASD